MAGSLELCYLLPRVHVVAEVAEGCGIAVTPASGLAEVENGFVQKGSWGGFSRPIATDGRCGHHESLHEPAGRREYRVKVYLNSSIRIAEKYWFMV